MQSEEEILQTTASSFGHFSFPGFNKQFLENKFRKNRLLQKLLFLFLPKLFSMQNPNIQTRLLK